MPSVFEALQSYFETDEWTYKRLGELEALEMGVAGENGNYRVVALVDAGRSIVRFLTFVEGKVPESRRRDVMEFVTRANYGLLLGNFELDLGDGEVRFKSSLDVEGGALTYSQYQNLLYVSLATVDRYFPGLERVIQGNADPAAAVSDVEH